MKTLTNLITYTIGIAIVAVFAFIVLTIMWVKEKFCKQCRY